jgi:hypothetical protein
VFADETFLESASKQEAASPGCLTKCPRTDCNHDKRRVKRGVMMMGMMMMMMGTWMGMEWGMGE